MAWDLPHIVAGKYLIWSCDGDPRSRLAQSLHERQSEQDRRALCWSGWRCWLEMVGTDVTLCCGFAEFLAEVSDAFVVDLGKICDKFDYLPSGYVLVVWL